MLACIVLVYMLVLPTQCLERVLSGKSLWYRVFATEFKTEDLKTVLE